MKLIRFVTQALPLSVLDEQGKVHTAVFPVGTKIVTDEVPERFNSFIKKGIIKLREATKTEEKNLVKVTFV